MSNLLLGSSDHALSPRTSISKKPWGFSASPGNRQLKPTIAIGSLSSIVETKNAVVMPRRIWVWDGVSVPNSDWSRSSCFTWQSWIWRGGTAYDNGCYETFHYRPTKRVGISRPISLLLGYQLRRKFRIHSMAWIRLWISRCRFALRQVTLRLAEGWL